MAQRVPILKDSTCYKGSSEMRCKLSVYKGPFENQRASLLSLQETLSAQANTSSSLSFGGIFMNTMKVVYEDWRRHKSDKVENTRLVSVLVDGNFWRTMEGC
ncbi:hypothetical protein VNO78_10594 [Psophocarpus tetragonolobus]|uniref:Uncharacterized protein n=1 Tax=Psophocarpus tetragonolobus TaxID=3891 RepID=A0AAN9XN47_PSOTE